MRLEVARHPARRIESRAVRPRTLLLATAAALAVLAAASAAYGGNGGIAPPDSATESGSTINEIYWLVIGITAAIFILVEGALILFILRYRRRRGTADTAEGPQIHGNTRLELIWTAIPALILVAIMVITIVKVPDVNSAPPDGSDPLVVQVDAHQFYWEYTYPNGVVSVDLLRLPIDRPVQLKLEAADVIHSWWVPELTGKRDAIPGRTNTLDFTPLKTGVFEGQCAELCGAEHAVMYTEVEVIPAAQFDAWLAAQRSQQLDPESEGGIALGRQTWEDVCAKCHGLDGQGDYGPPIAGSSLLADREGLLALLHEGLDNAGVPGYMPAVGTGWPDAQLDDLLAYLQQAELAPAPAPGG